jgi:hypothetical protein
MKKHLMLILTLCATASLSTSPQQDLLKPCAQQHQKKYSCPWGIASRFSGNTTEIAASLKLYTALSNDLKRTICVTFKKDNNAAFWYHNRAISIQPLVPISSYILSDFAKKALPYFLTAAKNLCK